MSESSNIKECRKCGATNSITAIKCSSCGEYFPTSPKTLANDIKKPNNKNSARSCPKCGYHMGEEEICESCGYSLSEEQPKAASKIFNKISDIFEKYRTGFTLCGLLIFFLLGFAFKSCIGIKPSEYEDLLQQKDEAIESMDKLQQEYDAYKDKMQPYEQQQAADEKAKTEKEIAEKKAAIEAEQEQKKAAEAKAAQEKAAEQAEREKQISSATFGISLNDFYTNFNNIASANGCNAFLVKQEGSGNYVDYTTLNSDVRVSCSLAYNLLSAITIDINRNTSAASLSDSAYYVVCSALAIDPSNSADEIGSLLTSLLNDGTANIGVDCKKTRSGIDYIINVSNSSILYQIQKAR